MDQLNVNYIEGLNQSQIGSIENLWSNKQKTDWNETDWSNWNYATNFSAVPQQNLGNSTPPPTDTPPAETTPATPIRYPEYSPANNDNIDNYYARLAQNVGQGVDEASIRQQMLDEAQKQIDAINSVYAGLISDEQFAGKGRVGQTRSIESARGLLGSPRGAAQMTKTEDYNADQIKAIKSEQAQTVANILAAAQGRAETKIQSERANIDKQAKDYIDFIKGQETAARKDLSRLAETGVDLKTLTDDQYRKLLEDSGFNSELEFQAYYNANKPQAEKVNYTYKELKDGTLLRMGDDGSYQSFDEFKLPETGNYSISQLDDGTTLLYNKDTGAYENIGKYAKPKSSSGNNFDTSGFEATDEDKQAILDDIAAITGQDGYLDYDKYFQIKKDVSTNKGLYKWFQSRYGNREEELLNPTDQIRAYEQNLLDFYTNNGYSFDEARQDVEYEDDLTPAFEQKLREAYNQ